ncbi:family 43 glycosylhydrolase [Pedobacter sp. Leaf170]|uniref:family 43 glycosylhydrolase n=1 Tax=Pedobacter sp. Leaf170 TaxID=2876558 RepID=UPI001E5D88D2|nr:family 43 glycosylhydrolase [Pedobacter sp. Leaf170]
MMKFCPLFFLILCFSIISKAQVTNFSATGKQLTRFDILGNAVDAHDGEIALFNGTYYLYGTSYDCGFEWNKKTAPFCGFKTYSSKDMVNWKDEGFLFDAKNPLWQSRCDGKTYGCFRPHVIYNKKNKNYVLWINVYDNVSGYRVFTSKSPIGPFIEADEPKIAVNSKMPAAGLNNGDHDLFIDDDGTGYLALTDWRTKGSIIVEQLTEDYLSGNGKVSSPVTEGKTEAPALFKRNDIYYITYSDPNCGYCSGTGTSYKTAKSPFGPWSAGKKISDNSCGGQPSFVSTMKINSETIYLYGSDLWNNAAKNEAQANYYWAPLSFADDGSINPMNCLATFSVKKGTNASPEAYSASCDLNRNRQRSQIFTAGKSGNLYSFKLNTLKSGYPDADLLLDFFEIMTSVSAKNNLLKRIAIPQDSIGWSAKTIEMHPNINLSKGKKYLLVISTESSKGCYGFSIGNLLENTTDFTSSSQDTGASFQPEKNRKILYSYTIK